MTPCKPAYELHGDDLGKAVEFQLGGALIYGCLEDVRHTTAMRVVDVAVRLVEGRRTTLFELMPTTIVRFP